MAVRFANAEILEEALKHIEDIIEAGPAIGAARGSKTYYQFQFIKTQITLKKSIRSGSARQEIILIFQNVQNRRLELDDMRVTANNIPVELQKKRDAALPFYLIEDNRLQILADSTYIIKMAFADNKEYSVSVRSGEKELSLLDLPAIHRRSEPLTLRWSGADSSQVVRIRTMRTVGVKGKQKIYPVEFTIKNPAAGEYTFPADFFTEYPDLSRVEFTVISTSKGQVDNAFAPGSYILAEFSVHDSVEIQ